MTKHISTTSDLFFRARCQRWPFSARGWAGSASTDIPTWSRYPQSARASLGCVVIPSAVLNSSSRRGCDHWGILVRSRMYIPNASIDGPPSHLTKVAAECTPLAFLHKTPRHPYHPKEHSLAYPLPALTTFLLMCMIATGVIKSERVLFNELPARALACMSF